MIWWLIGVLIGIRIGKYMYEPSNEEYSGPFLTKKESELWDKFYGDE